jgi:hypothetical protein
MQLIEITDPQEARRCRLAQYRGQKATVMLNGSPVTGMVRSVREHQSSNRTRWIVTVVPKQVRAAGAHLIRRALPIFDREDGSAFGF